MTSSRWSSLAETDTSDTLCDAAAGDPRERMRFPEPVISVSVSRKNKAELEKFGAALGGKMVRADPSLASRPTGETGRRSCAAWARLLDVTLDTHAHRVQRRGRDGRATGRLPRRSPSRSRKTTSTRSRPAVRASSPRSGSASSRSSAAPASSSRTRPSAAPCRRSSSPGREGPAHAEGGRRARPLPPPWTSRPLVDGSYHDVDPNALTFEIAAIKACVPRGHQRRPADPPSSSR